MECQYVATQRGGVALLFEGHRYNKVRDGKDGTVYWRCSRDRQCPGRAVTVNNRVKKANNKHNHPPEALRNGTSNANVITSVPITSGAASTSKDRSNVILPSGLALQDAIEAQNAAAAAAAAAASFPTDIITETLKYLIAASGNRQMAVFASSMSPFSNPSLINLDRALGRTLSSSREGLIHICSKNVFADLY